MQTIFSTVGSPRTYAPTCGELEEERRKEAEEKMRKEAEKRAEEEQREEEEARSRAANWEEWVGGVKWACATVSIQKALESQVRCLPFRLIDLSRRSWRRSGTWRALLFK